MTLGLRPHGLLRTLALISLTLALWLAGAPANAVIVGPFSLTGPGATSIDVEGNTTALTYAFGPAGQDVRTWTATAPVVESGLYEFDWSYSGTHAVTQVTAFLRTLNPVTTLVDEGPTDCCIPPSVGFDFSGSASFLVTAGETIGFAFGGSNVDANNTLIGTLEVSIVPLPPALWLLLLALVMTAFIFHRGRRIPV